MMDRGESEQYPVVAYGPYPDGESAVYFRSCPTCGRFVKADKTSGPHLSYAQYDMFVMPEMVERCRNWEPEPNATCGHCGRVRMEFSHWWNDD